MPTLPAATSRSAITVGLSRSASSSGCEPALIWRARLVAARVSSKRLGILANASSMVMRAIFPSCRPSDQFFQQRFVAYALLGGPQPRGAHDCAQIVEGGSKLLINNNIIELVAVSYLLAGSGQTACDGALVILAPTHQPLFERSERRRQYEDVDRRPDQLAN